MIPDTLKAIFLLFATYANEVDINQKCVLRIKSINKNYAIIVYQIIIFRKVAML